MTEIISGQENCVKGFSFTLLCVPLTSKKTQKDEPLTGRYLDNIEATRQRIYKIQDIVNKTNPLLP